MCLGVLELDMVESGTGADIAHRDVVESGVVEGVLVVVSVVLEGVHVMNMLAGIGSKRGGVTLSGSVSLIEHIHTGVEVSVGGVASIGSVLSCEHTRIVCGGGCVGDVGVVCLLQVVVGGLAEGVPCIVGVDGLL